MEPRRRQLLAMLAGLGITGIAGCIGDDQAARESEPNPTQELADDDDNAEEPAKPTPTEPPEPPDIEGAPPSSEDPLHLPHDPALLLDNAMSGGVPQDGIPSIDDPQFTEPDRVDLRRDDPVFGVVRDGEARAYPQEILVWHEIVNDTFAGERVAVTYCPLTGTAQGFERGLAEFGVSGQLVNSNLIMYDRSTDSWWPQVVATGIDGPMTGQHLKEFRVIWTTWERWQHVHPDTEVLSENTGYLRRYGSDPYGTYNPKTGYYSGDSTIFPPLTTDTSEHPKTVIIGTRTDIGAIAFNKELLLAEGILETTLYGEPFVAVAEDDLQTGFVYRNPDGVVLEQTEDGYLIDGEIHSAENLPMERSLAFDAMWFAWFGFYPDTIYVR